MCNSLPPSSFPRQFQRVFTSLFVLALIALAAPATIGAGELRSVWTKDAFAPSRGVLREAGVIPVVAGVSPGLDPGARVHFREFAPGELPVDHLRLSGGSWSCVRLSAAAGRASNGCHFLEFGAALARHVADSEALVSGLVLGAPLPGAADSDARETIKYLVPKAQETWFLRQIASSAPAGGATVRRAERQAFERATGKLADVRQPAAPTR